MAAGSSAMLGWLTRHPVLFEFHAGLLPMVFNTGACLALCGLALFLSGFESRPAQVLRWLSCTTVAVLTLLILAELALDRTLGVDVPSLHTWYDYGNTRPGRMAPNTAVALLLISLGIPLSEVVRTRRAAAATIAITFAVMTVGLLGLVGYLMSPDLLFGWAR